ncbi:hypothetical protein GGR55DRAFT_660656 [Xylaria sp. FL0064]|nr:hypothetical protein GGR55DRAFT_660656 [Xylaria sp. FL0064]
MDIWCISTCRSTSLFSFTFYFLQLYLPTWLRSSVISVLYSLITPAVPQGLYVVIQ